MMVELEQAVRLLLEERVVALPTETVYGLGGLATSKAAIAKIYAAKGRPQDNPLICHFLNAAHIQPYVSIVPGYWSSLVHAFSPGPVSYRLPLPEGSPLQPAVASQSTVACRIPDQPLCLEVIRQVGVPIAAPSANTSGKVSPTSAPMVEQDLGSEIAGVLDGGPCIYGLESTILDCCQEDNITILRPGAIGPDEITEVLAQQGFRKITVNYAKNSQRSVVPGNKYRHYAPDTQLCAVKDLTEIPKGLHAVVLMSQEQATARSWPTSLQPVILGSRHDLPHVAQHLYRHIKSVDEHDNTTAYYLIEDWGNSSLGRAIGNRLRRASQEKRRE